MESTTRMSTLLAALLVVGLLGGGCDLFSDDDDGDGDGAETSAETGGASEVAELRAALAATDGRVQQAEGRAQAAEQRSVQLEGRVVQLEQRMAGLQQTLATVTQENMATRAELTQTRTEVAAAGERMRRLEGQAARARRLAKGAMSSHGGGY